MGSRPIDHECEWGVVFLDVVGNNDDQRWVATCRVCGQTRRGDDAPSELGITAWRGERPGADGGTGDGSDTP
jgi:hypothetical protein